MSVTNPNPQDHLTRIWDATTPVEPTPSRWNSLWAEVSEHLDARDTAAAEVIHPMPARRRVMAVRLFIMAQAAAILAALGFWASYTPAPIVLAQAPSTAEFDAGEIGIIRDDGQGLRVVKLAFDDRSNSLDGTYAMYNEFESLAE